MFSIIVASRIASILRGDPFSPDTQRTARLPWHIDVYVIDRAHVRYVSGTTILPLLGREIPDRDGQIDSPRRQ